MNEPLVILKDKTIETRYNGLTLQEAREAIRHYHHCIKGMHMNVEDKDGDSPFDSWVFASYGIADRTHMSGSVDFLVGSRSMNAFKEDFRDKVEPIDLGPAPEIEKIDKQEDSYKGRYKLSSYVSPKDFLKIARYIKKKHNLLIDIEWKYLTYDEFVYLMDMLPPEKMLSLNALGVPPTETPTLEEVYPSDQ